MKQDQAIGQLGFHPLRIGDEVRGEITAVELHPLDDFQRSFDRLRLLHGNHSVLADLLHRLGDNAADSLVVVGRDGSHLGDHFTLHGFRKLLELLNGRLHRTLDTALQGHGVRSGGHVLHSFAKDGLGQHCCGGSPVARDVRGLGSDLAHHLSSHVLQPVFELDLFSHGDAVLGDDRRAELFVEYDVAAFGAQSDLYRVCELVHATQDRLARLLS